MIKVTQYTSFREQILQGIWPNQQCQSYHATAARAPLAYSATASEVLVFKCLHGLALAYLADYCQLTTVTDGSTRLRSANTQHLAVPQTNTGSGDRSFAVSGPSVWNSLPTALRVSDCSLTTFRTELKTLLFIWYIVYRQLHFLTAGQRTCGLLGGLARYK